MTGSSSSSASSARPVLLPVARSGLAGRVVDALEPHTEADPAAVLANFLAFFGAAVGPGPHVPAGDSRHGTNLFVAVVGDTARARKGTARASARRLLEEPTSLVRLPPLFHEIRGVGSGEGLIQSLHDLPRSRDPTARTALVVEEEFARLIKVMGRRGNTTGQVLRSAWDGVPLQIATRSRPLLLDSAHIAVSADVTIDELLDVFSGVDMMNGFGNRFLWVSATRAQLLPDGGGVPEGEVRRLRKEVLAAVTTARQRRLQRTGEASPGALRRTPDAAQRWEEIYRTVEASPASGVVGSITARAAPQILRLSLIYALLEGRDEIDVEHVEAAFAFWSYCEDSARYIFDRPGVDSAKMKIEDRIRAAGSDGITRTALDAAFSGHLDRPRLDELIGAEIVVVRPRPGTTGRPASVLVHAEHAEKAEKLSPT